MRRTRLPAADLAAAWEANAAGFIAWAREPDHDSYWRFHRDLFFELIAAPGRRTLDLGCGEGRLARDLDNRGHRVVAVDLSATMLAAARDMDRKMALCRTDASVLPFRDGSFDCVLAFMSLQDVQDFEGAIRETSRVLEPGGRFHVAIVHPIGSAGAFADETAESQFIIDGSYLDESFHQDDLARGASRRPS